jgi:2-keto-4-pentenoate hydratase/2-oxohepta-3-ene-1,7-dioic acid hydratase in catechol pathway
VRLIRVGPPGRESPGVERRTAHASEMHRLARVAGYALHTDSSERAFRLERGGQWMKGKVQLGIEGLGESRQRIARSSPST